MAPAEIEFCIGTFNGDERTVREKSVSRGNVYRSNFLAPAKVLVICDSQDNFGTVTVRGRQFLEVCIYENENDEEGRRIRSSKPIKFSGDQEIEIWANHKRRQMYVWHEKNDNDVPQPVCPNPYRASV